MSSVLKEILDLRSSINKWNDEYYVYSSPSVSDLFYDQALIRLSYLENKYPEYKTLDSPTLRLGSDLQNDFKEIAHTSPILSLDKVYTTLNLMSWINKLNIFEPLTFSMEPKIDGCSIVLYYKKGVLDLALTRGNGIIGNDVSENVRTIKNIPLTLPQEVDLVVRGEVYITKENFNKINTDIETPYSNARNLASGILRRIKSTEVASFPLDVFIYDILSSSLDLKTNKESIYTLKKFGFKINPLIQFFSGDNLEANIFDYISKLTEERNNFAYEIDGIVVKIDDLSLREKLGYTAHHPKWAIAYKFEALKSVSKVNNIIIQVGRSGKITPVAKLDKVLVSGALITNATLHNQDYITSLDLNIGDIVSISRRGDVIPAVEEVIEKLESGHYLIPPNCPFCGQVLLSEGAHLFCTNLNCSRRKIEQIKYFCSKRCMDIEGLSEKTIEFLFEKKFINSEIDLYTFDFTKLLEEEGFKDKKVSNLKDSVNLSKNKPFSRLLLGVGIKDLGANTIKLLLENGLNSFEKLEDLVMDKDKAIKTLLNIKGIGEKIAINIIEAFNSDLIQSKFKFFKENNFNLSEDLALINIPKNAELYGSKFCITGSFNDFSRPELIELLEKEGAVFTSSISKNLDFLVAGEKAGSKLQKAEALGIKIIGLSELKKYLNI